MTRHNIPLGRFLGISIGLDHSWFVGAETALMLFVGVLLHELGHSKELGAYTT